MLAGLVWLVVLWLVGQAFVPRPQAQVPEAARASASSTTSESWLDPALGDAASMITHEDNGVWGHNSEQGKVRCWSREGWKKQQAKWARRYGKTRGPLDPWRGFTIGIPRREIELPPNVCGELSTLENEPLPVWRSEEPYWLAYAVGVLAHEARHFSGASDEWSTECYGMQSIRPIAVHLGRTAKEGQYLASLYWQQIYKRESLAYRMPQCRDGRQYDLRPGSSLWP
jgi:hypothetical protein